VVRLVLQITVISVTGNCIQNAKVTSHIEGTYFLYLEFSYLHSFLNSSNSLWHIIIKCIDIFSMKHWWEFYHFSDYGFCKFSVGRYL